MAPIIHIVAVGFKDGVSAESIKESTTGFLKLKETCVNPTTGAPYIVSIKGGKDNSPEGLQNGVTHAFVVEFANESDRDYYVNEDPVHKAFGKGLAAAVSTLVVTDFADAVF